MKKEVITELDELRDAIRIHRITATVHVEKFEPIAASIKPLQHADGSDDIVALNEYIDFIINALEVFDEHDFEVIEERESLYSHSYYCTLVKRDQLEQMNYKYILFIRLSDHANRKESRRLTREHYSKRAQDLKQPNSKSKQTWRLKEITVNKDSFNSYDEALDYIDKQLP